MVMKLYAVTMKQVKSLTFNIDSLIRKFGSLSVKGQKCVSD